jgi:four helix bundle protein
MIYKNVEKLIYLGEGLYELETQFYLALDQKYVSENDFDLVIKQIQSCKKLLNGFINYYKNK